MVLLSFRPTEVILTHEKTVETRSEAEFLKIFLEDVKKTSVVVKLDRPQLQRWLLF